MAKRNTFLFVSLFIIFSCIYSCENGRNSGGMDVSESNGFTTKTFYNASKNIEVVIITASSGSLIAVPLSTTTRERKIGDDEYKCLMKCKKSDGTFDMNCVLLCPITKQYRVLSAN